jgi:hypothetical protein
LEAGRVADRIMSHVLPPDDLPGFPDARRTRPKTPRPGGGLSWRTRRRSASPASSAPESTPTASNGASNPCRSRGRRDATSLRINDLPSSCADLIRASTHWSKPGGRLHAAPGRLQASLDRRTGQHPSVTFLLLLDSRPTRRICPARAVAALLRGRSHSTGPQSRASRVRPGWSRRLWRADPVRPTPALSDQGQK